MTGFSARWGRLMAAVYQGPGRLEGALRQAAQRAPAELPEVLRRYVERVRGRAYTLTEEAIAELHAEGLDDDQIFELTVAAAVGEAERRRQAFARLWEEPR